MAVLFNQHWDIRPGLTRAYSDFVMTYYNPTLATIGIKLVGGYYVTVGMGPRIIAVGLAENANDLEAALASAEFESITDRLMEFVTHYHSKILRPTGRIMMDGYKVQTGLWKLHQYWNIAPGVDKLGYADFVTRELVPGLKESGLEVTAGWRVVVGSGPYILGECSAPNLVDMARAIESDAYKAIMQKLLGEYVTDYHSRILAPTGRVDLPILLNEMMAQF
ncbi:MAG: hypothetical protein ACLPSW_17695 [Roseiarcus sp.]